MGSGRSDEAQRTTLQSRLGEWRGGRMRGPAVAGRSQRLLPAPPGPRSGGPIAPELPGSSSGCRAGSGWNQRVGWRGARSVLGGQNCKDSVHEGVHAWTEEEPEERTEATAERRIGPDEVALAEWTRPRRSILVFYASSVVWRLDMGKRTGIIGCVASRHAKASRHIDGERCESWRSGGRGAGRNVAGWRRMPEWLEYARLLRGAPGHAGPSALTGSE